VDARAPGPRARLLDRLAVAGRIDEPTVTHLRERTDGGRDEAAVLAQARDAGVDHRLLQRLRTEQVLDAVADLLGWRAGSYVLVPAGDTDEDPDPSAPRLQVDAVLDRAGRRRDRLDRLAALVPSLDVVPAPEPDAPLTLDPGPDLRALLAAVDGRRDLRSLADLLGLGGPEVVRLIAGLHGLGLVSLPEPVDPAAAAWADVRSLEDLPAPAVPTSPAVADTEPPPPPTPPASPTADPPTPASPLTSEGGDTDVAAFLRELSSLALGDDVPTPVSRRRPPPGGRTPGPSTGSAGHGQHGPAAPPARQESDPARRRRGLFGRG
jgi:hypothetical protein